MAIAMVIRTRLEDRMLQAELPGYRRILAGSALPARAGDLVARPDGDCCRMARLWKQKPSSAHSSGSSLAAS